MAVVRCVQGHYYDDQRFSSCPHCGISVTPGSPDEKKAEGARQGRGLFGWLEREKTVALPRDQRAAASIPQSDKTVALQSMAKENAGDDEKTIGVYSGAKGNDYITGWLVCVEGPEKGRDYRLHHGFNRIGRDFEMDVQVMDDPEISRKNHCSIVYDERSNSFSAVPGKGTLTYCEDELLGKAKTLEVGDQLRLGGSVFEFIPFCRKGRVWEKEG